MQNFILMLLMKAIGSASPNIIGVLRKQVDDMVKRAAETPNPWDDIVAGLIQQIVGKPGEVDPDNDYR